MVARSLPLMEVDPQKQAAPLDSRSINTVPSLYCPLHGNTACSISRFTYKQSILIFAAISDILASSEPTGKNEPVNDPGINQERKWTLPSNLLPGNLPTTMCSSSAIASSVW